MPEAIDLWFDTTLDTEDIAARKRTIKATVLRLRQQACEEARNRDQKSNHMQIGPIGMSMPLPPPPQLQNSGVQMQPQSLQNSGVQIQPQPNLGVSMQSQQQPQSSLATTPSPPHVELQNSGSSAAASAAGGSAEFKGDSSGFNDPIDEQDLQYLIFGYDEQFFNEELSDYLLHQKTDFHIRYSKPADELRKGWAGVCQMENDKVTILLHPGFNSLAFKPGHVEEGCGVLCYDRLDCLMATLEHELVHMMMLVFYRAFKIAHGKPFQTLARGLFGHRLFTHAFGYGQGLDRIHRAHDKEIKAKKCNKRDMIAYSAGIEPLRIRFGMVLNKTQDYVTVMHSDGSVLDHIPFWNIHILEPAQFGFGGQPTFGMGSVTNTPADSFDLFVPMNESKRVESRMQ
jgi:hypothetical protein